MKFFSPRTCLCLFQRLPGCLKLKFSSSPIKRCIASGVTPKISSGNDKLCHTDRNSLPYFLTTPIFYVNANPHLGHLYTVVLADALTRWRRISGKRVKFSTGTDEHGLKIQQTAAKTSSNLEEFCEKVSNNFRSLFNEAGIEYTDFIRTTENRHHKAVSEFWRTLKEKGYIIDGYYEGWYSVTDEEFLTEDEVEVQHLPDNVIIQVSKSSKNPAKWIKEKNHVFKLTSFKSKLHKWLDKKVIHPQNFEPIVRDWVDNISDLSVSRQRDRVTWGIPVPDDNSQTIYVWLDALVNYLTVAGYPSDTFQWPADCQVVGKDILRFHAVFWPAFLMAAGLEPPKHILCHSHWLTDGFKMSKSRGNIIDPLDRMHKYSVDGLRYFLLKDGVPHSDCNYTDKKVLECINADVVNTLGNLLNRCTGKSVNPKQIFPAFNRKILSTHFKESDRDKFMHMNNMANIIGAHYGNYQIYRAIEAIIQNLHWANYIMQEHKPWELRKDPKNEDYLETVLHVALETMRICSVLLQPVIPTLSSKILDRLGVPSDSRTVQDSLKPYLLEKQSAPLGVSEGVLLKRLTN